MTDIPLASENNNYPNHKVINTRVMHHQIESEMELSYRLPIAVQCASMSRRRVFRFRRSDVEIAMCDDMNMREHHPVIYSIYRPTTVSLQRGVCNSVPSVSIFILLFLKNQ